MTTYKITPENLHETHDNTLRQAFKHVAFGAAPDSVDPAVAAWYWAFYASGGLNDQSAREIAIREVKYMAAAALGREPRVHGDGTTNTAGSLIEHPCDDDRPYAPDAALRIAMRQ